MNNTERIYGRTGEIGRDGLLTPEQIQILNGLQEKAANSCINYLDQMNEGEKYPLVAMATGFGKGNIIHRVIEKQIRKKPDSKVLVIAGIKLFLVGQTQEALSGYQQQTINTDAGNGNGFGYISSEEDDQAIQEAAAIGSSDNPLEDEISFLYTTGKIRQKDVNVHVATIQTVQSELQKGSLNPEGYDLVVVDEVHNIGTDKRKKAVQQFKNVVGFTATPLRHSGRMKTPEQYGFKVVESLPLPEAQELRILPPLVGIQIDTTSVLEDKIPTTLTGLIDYKKLEKLLKDSPNLRPYIADRLANIISQDGRNYKTVVAVNFVWEAQELAMLLKDKGIKVGIAVNQQAARALDSDEIPALDSIERYKLPESNDKSLQVLISPYVVGEGFDAPATEVLVWASPTDSDLRYTQYTGRLARRSEGKRFGVIVDCLYQTSQYNWSYNMGMWMKDNVRVLDNGLLYLGPETDIENLKKLPQVEGFVRESAKKSLEELQTEDLLEIQETDFRIVVRTLQSLFLGDPRVFMPIANRVVEELTQRQPELITKKRIKEGRIVTVCTNRDVFIQKMVEYGARLKPQDIQEVQEGDFVVGKNTMDDTFINGSHYAEVANRILLEMTSINPDWVLKARNKKRIVRVLRSSDPKEFFVKRMQEEGVTLKSRELETLKPNDFAVTVNNLKVTFLGDWKKLMTSAKAVLEELGKEDPSLVIDRIYVDNKGRKRRVSSVVINRERFIQEMIERGAKLKPPK